MHDFSRLTGVGPNGLRRAKVLVIGDVMLDMFVYGDVQRISPEAPVPVIRFTHETHAAGGCANVALNIASLGAEATVAGCIGEDFHGGVLKTTLDQHHVRTQAVNVCRGWSTIRKTRFVGNHQQIVRMDHEADFPAHFSSYETLWPKIETELSRQPGSIVLSDYAKGVLTPELCQATIRAGNSMNIPVIVDPKGSDYSKYAGCTILTPNLGELAAATRVPANRLDDLFTAGQELRKSLAARVLLVTRGRDGMTLLSDAEPIHIPTRAREVFDVSGAGDTAVGTIAAGIAAGIDLWKAVDLGNAAAGIVVGKLGTATVTWAELEASLASADGSRTSTRALA